jgi:hypothetical protein
MFLFLIQQNIARFVQISGWTQRIEGEERYIVSFIEKRKNFPANGRRQGFCSTAHAQ